LKITSKRSVNFLSLSQYQFLARLVLALL